MISPQGVCQLFMIQQAPCPITNLILAGILLNVISVHKNLLHIPSIEAVSYGNKYIKCHCAELWNSTFSVVINEDGNNSYFRSDS